MENEAIVAGAPSEVLPAPAHPQTHTHAHAHQHGGVHQGFTIYDGMLLGVVLVWAGNPAGIKWALGFMDPLAFNALRFTLATLVMFGLLFLGRENLTWQRGDGWKIVGLGLLGHGIYQTLFILGVDGTLAGNTALILSISPVFIASIGAMLGYERVRAYAWVGIALTLCGVGLVVLGTGKPLELGRQLVGDLLILLVTFMWALYSVLSQPLLKRYSAVKLNALVMPVGAVTLLVVSAPTLVTTAPRWTAAPAAAWAILAASGVLALSAAYAVWYKGIQKLGATRTAVYSNLVPILAAFISFFFLHEPLGWQFWTGMAVVVLGVTLARFGHRVVRRQGA